MGPGRALFNCLGRRSQGFVEGPKNALGLKLGLKKEGTVDGANGHRQALMRALGSDREVGAVRS